MKINSEEVISFLKEIINSIKDKNINIISADIYWGRLRIIYWIEKATLEFEDIDIDIYKKYIRNTKLNSIIDEK